MRWAGTVGQIGKTAVVLGDAEVCAQAYELFLPFADQYSGDGSGGIFSEGAVARLIGDFARVAGRPADALAHYRVGMAMNARIGARPFAALSRLGLAQALVDLGARARPGHGRRGSRRWSRRERRVPPPRHARPVTYRGRTGDATGTGGHRGRHRL